MLGVRTRIVRRWAATFIAVTLAAAPGVAASPGQTGPDTGETTAAAADESTLVDVDVLVNTDSAAVATELEDLGAQINEQLEAYKAAQQAVSEATSSLADVDAALLDTQLRIEETTEASDQVAIDAYINPPAENALDVLAAENLVDATVKDTLLNMEADRSADSLTELQDALAEFEELEAQQEEALSAAQTAKAEAEAKLGDLESTLSAQALFVTQVQTALADQAEQPAPDDPEEAQARLVRQGEIASALEAAAEARALAEAQRLAEEARRRRIEAGIMFCPVEGGGLNFIDSWGYARSGGRAHKGVDMMAAHGTPTVAPVSGEVQHRGTSLGGLSWYVYGDNGNTYYGTHLSGYANQGAGWVEAGTVIGYVGSSGNASATAPHLHFEIHPGGGSPINPYPATAEACFG